MNPKTVNQIYYIDENLLEKLALSSKGNFFSASLKFYQSVKNKPIEELSDKQKTWLIKLQQILEEKERKHRQKEINKIKVKKCFTWWPKKTKDGWVWLTYYTFDI